MSNEWNDKILEERKQDFEEAVAEEDWEGAATVIDWLRSEGFEEHANQLEKELEKAKELNEELNV